jgi:single-strand DNA-binding protein
MVNRVTLIGHTGQDPEIRTLESGIKKARVSLATSESYKDRNGETQKLTEWHDLVFWRQTAEIVEQYVKKGMLLYIEGKLTHRTYEDKDKVTRKMTEVVVDTIRILDGKRSDSSGSGSNYAPKTDTTVIPPMPVEAGVEASSDDLPF